MFGIMRKFHKANEEATMSITEITRDNFESEITNSPVPSVLDFWGPGCGPCMAIMPKYHELAGNPKYAGKCKFCSVDTSRNRRVAMMVRPAVMGLPAFVFFRDGHEAARLSGGNVTIEAVRTKIDELVG